jgi:hypothetical protein
MRVSGSCEKKVLGNGFRFRAVRDAQRLRDWKSCGSMPTEKS